MAKVTDVKTYRGTWYGEDISEYGQQHGYIDYGCLSRAVGAMILNNDIMQNTSANGYYWDLYNGNDYNEDDDYYYDVFQMYIIDYDGAELLARYTDEIVYYNEQLDIFLWGITHYGTSWDYVLTDIKIEEV